MAMEPPSVISTTTVNHQTMYSEAQPIYERKHLTVVRYLGLFEVILGVVSLACGISTLVILHGYGTYGTGVWGGIWNISQYSPKRTIIVAVKKRNMTKMAPLHKATQQLADSVDGWSRTSSSLSVVIAGYTILFILAGAFAISVGNKSTTSCMVNTHMALSIVAAVVAGVQVIWTAVQAVHVYFFVHTFERLREERFEREDWTNAFSLFGLFTALSVFGGLSMIVHIVSASFCCCALPSCCRGGPIQPSHVLVTQGTAQTFRPVNQGIQAPQYPGGNYPPPGYARF